MTAGQHHSLGVSVDGSDRHPVGRGGTAVLAGPLARHLLGNRVVPALIGHHPGHWPTVAVASGWIPTGVGRQRWTVWQVLRTVDAARQNSGLWRSHIAVLACTAMTVGAVAAAPVDGQTMAGRRHRSAQPLRTAAQADSVVTLPTVVAMAKFCGVIFYALGGADCTEMLIVVALAAVIVLPTLG